MNQDSIKTFNDSIRIRNYADLYTMESNKDTNLAASDKIEIIYYPFVKGRQLVENEDEINRINTQTGRNGRISRYESRNDVASNDELYKIAKTYIDVKGQSEITLTITTKDNDLFNIGQQVYFNAPLDELKKNYLVKAKEIQITQTVMTEWSFINIPYQVHTTANKQLTFFDNQRRKSEGNLDKGQFITRYLDYNEEVELIFDNFTITKQENDNELDSELDLEL